MNKAILWLMTFVLLMFGRIGDTTAQVIYQTDPSGTITYETHQVDMILIQHENGDWEEMFSWGSRPLQPGTLECAMDVVCSSALIAPIVVGIIIGAAANGIGAVIQGQNAGQVIASTLLGGAAGLYGGVAGMTTGFGRILWGANAIAVEGGALGVIGRNQ